MGKLSFYSLLASLFQGLYVVTWLGWWFIFLIIIGFFLYSILNNFLIHRREPEGHPQENIYYAVSGTVFLLGSIFFVFYSLEQIFFMSFLIL